MMRRDIHPLNLSQVEDLLDWAAEEGWNPGLDDAAPFYAADPGGFLGCFVGERMAAGMSAIRYGENFGFIGLYISHPDFRGQGHGRALWDHAMETLGARSIGLDGVPGQQQNYAKMGFEPAYRTIRWSGRFPALTTPSPDVIAVKPELLPQILALDGGAFPAARPDFLERWIAAPRIACALLSGETVEAFGVLRRCRDGFKIGPLTARSDRQAETILSALAMQAGSAELHIDVPESQAVFSAHLAGLGFTRGFVTARMYRGTPPRHERHLVYGVTTLELG
jgi:GNAT superfamily N-acetyltransferase